MDGSLLFLIVVLGGVAVLGAVLYGTLSNSGAGEPMGQATIAAAGMQYTTGTDFASKELYAAVATPQPRLQELTPAERLRFEEAWRDVQEAYADDPEGAIRQADGLARELMTVRGYSMVEVDGDAPGTTVDHSAPVSNYRIARSLTSAYEMDIEGTVRLQEAMDRYGALFTELLMAPPAAA